MVGGVAKPDRVLELLEKVHYDLVILAINMQSLSGYDLLKKLKEKHGNNLKIGFVSITPKNNVKNLDKIDLFIQKPFDSFEIVKKVKNFFLKKGF
jgi:DNA-binding response OmpR family regulator